MGGQWGSEAKGCAAAWIGAELGKQGDWFDIWTTNAGAQAGHTSIHKGKKRVVYHLPTAPLVNADVLGEARGKIYLNAGSIIDPVSFEKELVEWRGELFIHPMAAVITDECREAEGDSNSGQTKIASTRKGVGEALARKVLRTGMVAKDHPFLKQFVLSMNLNNLMGCVGQSVLAEIPQGVSLSLNHSGFYPYTTSRDCTPMAGMSDACIHPKFYGQTMVVFRTFPIRVGNIVEGGEELGTSGGHYADQEETSWGKLGVEAEITTVTKRVRRVFTFSVEQMMQTMSICRPDIVFLAFCNYADKYEGYMQNIEDAIRDCSKKLGLDPTVVYQWGATTDDIGDRYDRS